VRKPGSRSAVSATGPGIRDVMSASMADSERRDPGRFHTA
jgi:hypothetical protein